jgi:hypothetical protein
MNARRVCAWFTVVMVLASPGCVELQQWLIDSGGTGGNGDDSGEVDPPVVDPGDRPFSVRLTASNTNPGLGEQVSFECTVESGDATGVRFQFDSSDSRLVTGAVPGRAAFIVTQSDIGVELSVRCSAENAAGDSDQSDEIRVIPL